jgi:hypothetical protein
VSRDLLLQVFSRIIFPQAPENKIRGISNFFENSRRYTLVYSGAWVNLIHEKTCCRKSRGTTSLSGDQGKSGSKTLAVPDHPVLGPLVDGIVVGGKGGEGDGGQEGDICVLKHKTSLSVLLHTSRHEIKERDVQGLK